MNLPAEELYNYICSLDQAMIREILMEGTNTQSLDFVVINLIRKFERDSISLPYDVMTRRELSQFNKNISRLSFICREDLSFDSQMIRFREHRKALMYKLSSIACELDRNSSRITIMKLFGYIVVVFSSLNLGMFLGRSIMELSFKITPFLRLSVQNLFFAASCFGPMCFGVSFANYLRCKYVIYCVTNMIEEDKKHFNRISNSNLRSRVMQFFSRELLSQTTEEEIIYNVKDLANIETLEITEKIFAAILISEMKNNPSCFQDMKFLYKTYLFSKTELASLWFNRLKYYIDPVDKIEYIRNMNDGSLHLKMVHLGSTLPTEFLLTPAILNRVVLSGLHSLCFCYEIRKYKHANKCIFSDDLRNLAVDSQNALGNMNLL